MSIKSKARIASLSNAAIDVHGRRKSVIYGLSRYSMNATEIEVIDVDDPFAKSPLLEQ
jgi:hypothetical protein